MSLSESVWDRHGSDEMGVRLYVTAVSFFTILGLVISSVLGVMTMDWKPNIIVLILVGLVIPILGIFIALRSDDWPISLIGYLMLVVPFGAIMGPTVAMYKIDVVITAFLATAGVTLFTSLIGIIYPKSLEHWGGYLFTGLLALLGVRIVQIFLPVGVEEPGWYIWVEYAGALLFSLYIIFDWNRAMQIPRTLDNAVDSALAIYLDIVNLFLHLLRIFGSSSDD